MIEGGRGRRRSCGQFLGDFNAAEKDSVGVSVLLYWGWGGEGGLRINTGKTVVQQVQHIYTCLSANSINSGANIARHISLCVTLLKNIQIRACAAR